MKKILVMFVWLFASATQASEIVRIHTPYTATHSGNPAMFRIIDVANSMQKQFTFVLEFRPGGNQTIAVKQMDLDPQNSLAIVAASFVENTEQGALTAANYTPIWSLGDACWLVMSTNSRSSSIFGLRDNKELTVGTVSAGNATHLTALQIAKKYNLQVRLIPFKSNNDAVVNMVGNNGVTFGMDNPTTYENLKSKNSKLKILAVSCPKRLADYPEVATLQEQGIVAPAVINIVVANTAMAPERRQRMAKILESATEQIGETEILRLSGFVPPQFNKVTAQEHFTKSMTLIKDLRVQFKKEINQPN